MSATEKRKLNIVGAGGFGQEVSSMLPYCGYTLGKRYDDDLQKPHLAGTTQQIEQSAEHFIIAVGNSQLRKALFVKLPADLHYATLEHKAALLQEQTSIEVGAGTIITAGCILTCNIQLGRHNIINLNCTLGHGVTTGDFCSLMPAVNLGGEVTLQEGVYIGTGASVLPGLTIGAWSVIGAGAIVTKDVPPHTTVKGVPAK